MCLSVIALCAKAQIEEVNTVKTEFWNFLFTPYSFSFNGTNLPHIQTEDNRIDVYSNEFNLSKTIDVNDEMLYSTRKVEQAEIIDITFDDKFLQVSDEPVTIYKVFDTDEDFVEYIKSTYGVEVILTESYWEFYDENGNYRDGFMCITDTIIREGSTIPISGYIKYYYYGKLKIVKVEYEYRYYEEYEQYYLTQLSIEDVTPAGTTDISGLTTDEILAFLGDYQYVEAKNGKWFARERDCYQYEKYGAKYPIEGYKVIDNKLYRAEYSSYYDENGVYHYFSSEGITFQLSDKTTYLLTDTTDVDHSLAELYYYDVNNGLSESESGFIVSQKLFNDDAGYEYITMVPKAFQYVTTNESYYSKGYDFNPGETKQIYTRYMYSGFNIVSENGNVLTTVNFPNDFVTSSEYARVIHLGDNYYLLFSGYLNYNYDENSHYDYATVVYKLNVSSSGANVQQVGQPILINVTPTILDKSGEVNVSLSDESRNHEVRVSDMQGRTIERKHIPAGQKNIAIPAFRLNNGMNIINVLQNQKVIGSQKVIVK